LWPPDLPKIYFPCNSLKFYHFIVISTFVYFLLFCFVWQDRKLKIKTIKNKNKNLGNEIRDKKEKESRGETKKL
jgi:hypothetical protein